MRLLVKLLIVAVISIVFTGCASPGSPKEKTSITLDEVPLYEIYIDSNGALLDPTSDKTTTISDEDTYITNILGNFERKNAEPQKSGKPSLQLTIFIHGGLNTFENARDRVTRDAGKMLDDGKYPLFISWDSGALPNVSDHIFFLRRGVKTKALGVLSSPFVMLEDALRSLARVPASTYNVLFDQNTFLYCGDKDLVCINSNEKLDAAKDLKQISANTSLNIHVNQNDTGFTLGEKWTIWNPVKLFTAPMVDGVGTGAWDSMLRRTDLVLLKDIASANNGSLLDTTAATKFLDRWANNHPDRKVILIGHSMGTIIANNIINKYQDKIDFNRIVYMAAACRIKDIDYVIAPYLDHNKEAVFYNLSLHPDRDLSENSYYDFVPRGSLLIWIDQTFASINSFQDRTAGYWLNIVRSASQTFADEDIRNRVHLTRFPINNCPPQKQSEFGESEFWKEEFWKGTQIPIDPNPNCVAQMKMMAK